MARLIQGGCIPVSLCIVLPLPCFERQYDSDCYFSVSAAIAQEYWLLVLSTLYRFIFQLKIVI